MFKNILSVMAGLIVGICVISLMQRLSHSIYPFPADTNWNDTEAARIALQKAPAGALLLVLAGYIAGSFAAGLVAALIAPLAANRNAIITGGILMVFGLINLVMLPHPAWFWASLAVYVPFALLGAKTALGLKRKPLH